MSIKIKKLTGETFDLPSGFIIEGEKTNPLFSKKGSQTVSISFPNTPLNRKLLDYAFRLDLAEKPAQTMPVAIESGAIQQTGIMAINSASPKLIAANIGFDEAEMYNVMADMQLKDMPVLNDPLHPEYNWTPAGDTREERVEAILSHLTDVMKQEVEDDYSVFPVVLKSDVKETRPNPDPNPDAPGIRKIYRVVLNEVITDEDAPEPYGAIAELAAGEHRMLMWLVDDEVVYIDAMIGYGVSPFLKVGKLLEIIFQNFGYTVEENPFATHRQLRKLVVLNNVMDAILSGTLHYRDMMPSASINDFLDSLYNRFGLLYYIDSNIKTVRFRFIKDLVDMYASETVNLNALKTEEPEITWSPQKQLKLTANRGLKSRFYSTETLRNTFEEFLAAYNNQFVDSGSPTSNEVDLYFITSKSTYTIYESLYVDILHRDVLNSSDFFDWDKKTPGIEYEEIKMDDPCLPFDLINAEQIVALFYGANMQHHYSDVIVEGETSQDEENPAGIAFAFGWGLTSHSSAGSWNWFFASQINRDVDGNFMNDPDGIRYDISLTINRVDGLYNRFWKNYDAFIRHSSQTVKCNMKLSDVELFRLRMDRTMIVNNQPLIPEEFKFKLNDPKNVTEGTFRTLRLYQPCDLDVEQHIPTYENQKYYWQETSVVKVPVLTYPYTETGFAYGFVTIDGVRYDTNMLFTLPPTDEQFQNNEQIILTYNSIAKASGHPDVPLTTTVTFTPTLIDYS
jgi:hypothetical protein